MQGEGGFYAPAVNFGTAEVKTIAALFVRQICCALYRDVCCSGIGRQKGVLISPNLTGMFEINRRDYASIRNSNVVKIVAARSLQEPQNSTACYRCASQAETQHCK